MWAAIFTPSSPVSVHGPARQPSTVSHVLHGDAKAHVCRRGPKVAGQKNAIDHARHGESNESVVHRTTGDSDFGHASDEVQTRLVSGLKLVEPLRHEFQGIGRDDSTVAGQPGQDRICFCCAVRGESEECVADMSVHRKVVLVVGQEQRNGNAGIDEANRHRRPASRIFRTSPSVTSVDPTATSFPFRRSRRARSPIGAMWRPSPYSETSTRVPGTR